MIFNVSISTLPLYTLFSFSGDVDVHKVSALAAFLHSDPHYAQMPNSVWDFTNAVFLVPPEEAVNLAHMILAKRMPGLVGRAAFITPDYEEYRKSEELFAVSPRAAGLKVEAFPTIEGAVFWFDEESRR